MTDTGEPRPAASTGPYVKSDRAAQRQHRAIRLTVLVGVLVLVTGLGLLHRYSGVKLVGTDALCPFGGLETAWALISGGVFLQRVAASSLVLLGAILLTAVIFRRTFCGYICPLGTIQELSARLGRRMLGRRPVVPASVDRPARWVKYAVLAGFTLWTWVAGTLVMRPYDPWAAWQHLTSAELLTDFAVGAVVLALAILGSVVYDRVFCKYLCPTGALLALVGRMSLFRVRREASTCIDCKACDKACPVNIEVSTVEYVTDPECIGCDECVTACPVADTMVVSTKPREDGARTVIGPERVITGTVGILVGFIVVTTLVGTFQWTKGPLGEPVPPKLGEAAKPFNVDEVRGSSTFAEVAKATGIPLADMRAAFGFTPSEDDTKIKDLAAKYGFDFHGDVRDWIAREARLRGLSVIYQGVTLDAIGGTGTVEPSGGSFAPAPQPAPASASGGT